MLRNLAIAALVPIFAIAAFAGAYFFYYEGSYTGDTPVHVPYEEITAYTAPSQVIPDSPAIQVREGLLVVDALHRNTFRETEAAALISKVSDRGYTVEFLGSHIPVREEIRLAVLEEKLRRADTLLVILPRDPYTESEVALVESFVRKGGKLLLVSDPSRAHRINSLANRFGLNFQPDYLYDTVEYDQNFRHIFVRDFQPDTLTAGLDSILLEYAGSVRSSGPGLAFAGPNTKSSVLDSAETLSPIAWGDSPNVLALGDFTFMVPSNNIVLDNDRFISNIADFMTDSERRFDLRDYPYFYESGPDADVDILLGQPSLYNIGLSMRNGLASNDIASQISGIEDTSRDSVFLGLYDDAVQVSHYLQAAGVRIDDSLGTPFGPELELGGTSVIVLAQDGGRDMLVVLADSERTLADAVISLMRGNFRDSLVSDYVGVQE